MPPPRRIRIATVMVAVVVVALVIALVQREREVRRLRAELEAARGRDVLEFFLDADTEGFAETLVIRETLAPRPPLP